MENRKKIWSKLIGLLFLASVLIVIYIIYSGLGKINGLDFGAGAFYYTDIPDWQERFFGSQSIKIGTRHPLLFLFLFFLWGYLCFKALLWLDKR